MQPVSISVLLPVYNGQKYLRQAINSILAQSKTDFELIVIDDCSSDGSLNIIREVSQLDPRIKIIRNAKNLGLTKSLNIGFESCKGKYIARMDADDISSPQRLELQFKFMEDNSELAMCGSQGMLIDEGGKQLGEKNLPLSFHAIKDKLLFNNQFIHSSLFFRKNILEKEGRYNEDFKTSQDYELALRLASKFKVANVSMMLVCWRVGKNSLSWTSKRQEIDALKARWYAITRYGYPKFKGLSHILLRLVWILVPQRLKIKRYDH